MFRRNYREAYERMRNIPHFNQNTYNASTTEPWWPDSTAPVPPQYLSNLPWHRRALYSIGRFCAALIRKLNQLLGFLLWILTLLLAARFLFTLFGLTHSLFSQWIFAASAPFMFPFERFMPISHYGGYAIDGSILVAIFIYWLGVFLVRRFLKLLVTRPA